MRATLKPELLDLITNTPKLKSLIIGADLRIDPIQGDG